MIQDYYSTAYDDVNNGGSPPDPGTGDPGTGDPNAGAPGYHYDPTQGIWVPDAPTPPSPRVPVHNPAQPPNDPVPADPNPAPPPTVGPATGVLAPFSEAAPAIPQEPAFQPRPDFVPTTFTAPTIGEAANDPGYQFRTQQGQQSLQNWAAARGTLNDSDTAKMLIDYGQNAAEQGYGSVYARDYGAWQGNEADRFGAWSGNNAAAQTAYGLNRQSQYIDPYTAAYNAWAQRGNFYLSNQGTAASTALGYAQL